MENKETQENIDNLFPDQTEPQGVETHSIDNKIKEIKDRREVVVNRLKQLFDFHQDMEHIGTTIDLVKADVNFHGTKLWILICAIFVASLGLNTNSTAVIIGAMLISPLMGPIIGFGMALGIYDFELLKKSLRNLALATLFSVLASAIYFFITPIAESGSELLGRTQPTVYDVLIALFGGAAGMIAISTRSKGQVIPGVAIATALMPPLCTAGYGIGTGQWHFFFGAFYLYLINSVFIALATYLIVRLFRFPAKAFKNAQWGQKVHRIIWIIIIGTIAPAAYLTVGLVRDSLRANSAHKFVDTEFKSYNVQVVKYKYERKDGVNNLDVVLLGNPLEREQIDSLEARLSLYGLGSAHLKVHQAFKEKTDLGTLRSSVLKDLYENSDAIIQAQRTEIDSLKEIIGQYEQFALLDEAVGNEALKLFPDIKQLYLVSPSRGMQAADSTYHVIVTPQAASTLSKEVQKRIIAWLQTRTQAKEIQIVINNP